MNKIAKTFLIIVSIIFFISIIGSVVFLSIGYKEFGDELRLGSVSISQTKDADITGLETIRLEDIGASIIIKSESSSSKKVTATLDGFSFNKISLSMENRNNILTFSMNKNNWFQLSFYNDLTLTIKIPISYSGDLELNNIGGEAQVFKNGSSPKINSLTVKNNGGSMNINGDYKRIDYTNGAGEIKLSTTNDECDINAQNCAGDITIKIPEKAKGSFDVKNCVGGFSSDFEYTKNELFNYSGTINGGGKLKVDIRDCFGNVSLNKN